MPRTRRQAEPEFRVSPWQEKRCGPTDTDGASPHVVAFVDLQEGGNDEAPAAVLPEDQSRVLEEYTAELPEPEPAADGMTTTGQGHIIFYPTGELEGRATAADGESLPFTGEELSPATECGWDVDWQLLRLHVFPAAGGCGVLLCQKRGGDVARLSPLEPHGVEEQELAALLAGCTRGGLSFDCEQHLDGAQADAALRRMRLGHAAGRDAVLNLGAFAWRLDAPRGLVAGGGKAAAAAQQHKAGTRRPRSQPKPVVPYDSDLDG